MADKHCSLAGEAATSLLEMRQGARYIQLPHTVYAASCVA